MSVFRPKTSAFKLAGDGSRAPLCRRAIVGLVEHALERLAALRLIRRAGDAVHPLPALARYALAAPTLAPETRA